MRFWKVTELPLKNFYRLVLGPSSELVASFERLPTRDILTQRLDTPEPWNVQALAALQDVDNLRQVKKENHFLSLPLLVAFFHNNVVPSLTALHLSGSGA